MFSMQSAFWQSPGLFGMPLSASFPSVSLVGSFLGGSIAIRLFLE